jgi:phage shock protein PspC (stress-responsive transcriptional regulator)
MPDEPDTPQHPDEADEPRPAEPQPEPAQPRPRLTRSSTDSLIGGVAGGLGRHLNVDPLAIRITFVILSFAGGLGVLAYLAFLVLLPSDDPAAEPLQWGLWRTLGAGLLAVAAIAILVPHWLWGPELGILLIAGVILYVLIRVVRDDGASHISGMAARIAIGIVLVAVSVGGFVAAAAGSALGGGIAVAGLVIACGVGLVGGAFRGGARWLIGPALVLSLPLAAVAATDLDLRGTWGDRTYTPTTVQELERGYDMGAGSMRVDLRDVDLPPGRTTLPLELGAGEIQVLVPSDVCVLTDARVRMGAVDDGRDEQGGVDLDITDRRAVAPGTPTVRLDVDLGLGAVRVGDRFRDSHGPGGWHLDDATGPSPAVACAGTP